MTEAELRAACERNPSPEVRRLLWEIARLHALARRAKEVAYSLPLDLLDDLGVAGVRMSLMALRRELEREACVGPTRKWPSGLSAEEEAMLVSAAPPGYAKREVRRRRNG